MSSGENSNEKFEPYQGRPLSREKMSKFRKMSKIDGFVRNSVGGCTGRYVARRCPQCDLTVTRASSNVCLFIIVMRVLYFSVSYSYRTYVRARVCVFVSHVRAYTCLLSCVGVFVRKGSVLFGGAYVARSCRKCAGSLYKPFARKPWLTVYRAHTGVT